MDVTTKKRAAGSYRLRVNGRLTSILVEKGLPPRFGEAQKWDVVLDASDSYLFEARGLDHAISTIRAILEAADV